MKKKFLALILAISMIPAPIASYAQDDNKCKKELEWCMAENKDLSDELSNCSNITDSCNKLSNDYKKLLNDYKELSNNYKERLNDYEKLLNVHLDGIKEFRNFSDELLDSLKSQRIEIFIYRTVLLLIFGPKIVRFFQNFRE